MGEARPYTPETMSKRMTTFPKWYKTDGPRGMKDGWVYFIRSGEYVKIGWSTDVPSRLAKLRTGNPHELTLLFACKAMQVTEIRLHEQFHEYRHRDEWFRIEGELKEFLEAP